MTAISFSLLVRYTDAKLDLYKAEVLGKMPLDVVEEMIAFLISVKSLPAPDKEAVRISLESLLHS
ncbi:hypothetical protein ACQQ2Q_02225 [Agrobacterium sp. ES01]|uniref:hypothetical protein n=1 Tax=Agrobacterium sp. ES01 TaxID=3420714 RepID=UPI003D0C2DD1